jgi:hypothetical protein
MNYTCIAREEADDHAADRLAALSVRFTSPALEDREVVGRG